MAVTTKKLNCSLLIMVESGVAPDGSATYSNRTISKIDPALSDADAYSFASAVSALQSYPVGDIQRSEKSVFVVS